MILSVVLAVAEPWTHWLAVPLLVGSVIYLVGVGIGYYRTVQVPWYRLTLRQQQQPRQQQVVPLHATRAAQGLRRPSSLDPPGIAAA